MIDLPVSTREGIKHAVDFLFHRQQINHFYYGSAGKQIGGFLHKGLGDLATKMERDSVA
jgi:hypothetical protein